MVQHSRFAWLVWLVWMHSAITCIVFNDDRRSCMSWTKQTTNRKNTDQPKSWTCWRLSKSRPLSSCMRTACPPRVRARFRPWPAGHSCRRQATTPRTNPHARPVLAVLVDECHLQGSMSSTDTNTNVLRWPGASHRSPSPWSQPPGLLHADKQNTNTKKQCSTNEVLGPTSNSRAAPAQECRMHAAYIEQLNGCSPS